MIIDAHTHFTTAPPQLQAYRGQQITNLAKPIPAKLQISDEELARSMEGQFKRMEECGIDRLLFSPQAGAMGHHFGSPLVSRYWTEACNDLIARVAKTVARQSLAGLPTAAVARRRSEGMGRRAGSLRQGLGFHRLQRQSRCRRRKRAADAVHGQRVVVSAVGKDGGARRAVHRARQRVAQPGDASDQFLLHRPSQFRRGRATQVARVQGFSQAQDHHSAWRRGDSVSMEPPTRHARQRRTRTFRRCGAASLLGHGDLRQRIDGAVDQAGRRRQRVLFATEMFGAVNAIDPKTGRNFEDLVPIFNSVEGLSEQDRYNITEGNARRVFSRLFADSK